MTKPRSVAATANDNSIPGSRIKDETIVNAKVSASAGIVATKLSFVQAGTGAVARTVSNKLEEIVSVKDFGAVGDGIVDDGPAIRRAGDYLNSRGGGILHLEANKVYRCTTEATGSGRRSCIRLYDNMHLEMNGSTIEVDYFRPVATAIDLTNSINTSVKNGVLIGHKDKITQEGPVGMAVYIVSCTNTVLENLECKDFPGDGLYVGRFGGNKPYAENVICRNIVCDGNERQGLSIITGVNCLFENCVFKNTIGRAPQDGVDFEPNSSDEFLQNIYLKNIVCDNNAGEGIKFFLDRLDQTSQPISVTFENVSCVNRNNKGIRFRRGSGVTGVIRFIGSTFVEDCRSDGFRFEDFQDIEVYVEDLEIRSAANYPLYIGAGSNPVSRGAENLTIDRLRVRGFNGESFERGVYFRGINQPFIRNIKIKVRDIETPSINDTFISLDAFTGSNIVIEDLDPYNGVTVKNNSTSSVLTTFSPFRYLTRTRIDSGSLHIIGGLRIGSQTTTENDRVSGSVTVVTSTSSPQQILPGAPGTVLTLPFRKSWVTVMRDPEDGSFRVIDGVGYTFV